MAKKKEIDIDGVTAEEVEAVLGVKEEVKSDKVEIDRSTLEAMQEQIKMLVQVADKGRVMNYESQKSQGKKPMKVKLSKWDNGIVIGWRTAKDELIKNPTTGLTVGEQQEYELIILNADGSTKKITVNGYPQFSNVRYDTRIEGEVVGKKENFEGNLSFDVRLDDGRVISIDSRFIN